MRRGRVRAPSGSEAFSIAGARTHANFVHTHARIAARSDDVPRTGAPRDRVRARVRAHASGRPASAGNALFRVQRERVRATSSNVTASEARRHREIRAASARGRAHAPRGAAARAGSSCPRRRHTGASTAAESKSALGRGRAPSPSPLAARRALARRARRASSCACERSPQPQGALLLPSRRECPRAHARGTRCLGACWTVLSTRARVPSSSRFRARAAARDFAPPRVRPRSPTSPAQCQRAPRRSSRHAKLCARPLRSGSAAFRASFTCRCAALAAVGRGRPMPPPTLRRRLTLPLSRACSPHPVHGADRLARRRGHRRACGQLRRAKPRLQRCPVPQWPGRQRQQRRRSRLHGRCHSQSLQFARPHLRWRALSLRRRQHRSTRGRAPLIVLGGRV